MSSPLADFELTVAGVARLFGGQLDDEARTVLSDGVGTAPDGDWAAVFAYVRYPDGTVEKVTIFTAEAGYAQRLAGPSGGRIPLPAATVQQRFPKVRPGWVIDDGDGPPEMAGQEAPHVPSRAGEPAGGSAAARSGPADRPGRAGRRGLPRYRMRRGCRR